MWMLRWFRWLSGYVIFEAQGGLCERFLRLVSEDGVHLWDVCHTAYGVRAVCAARDYRRLRRAAARTGTRVRHLRQRGAYVAARPLKKQSGLLTGAVLALAVYMVLAARVWVIDLPSGDPTLVSQVEQCLEKANVRRGVPIRDIDVAAVRMAAVTDVPALHALGLSFEGCVVHVEWRLQEEELAKPDETPANVIAAADGVILSAQVTAGQSMIRVGEAVVEGELLVCGAVETERETLFRHATATVIARTEREVTVTASLTETEEAYGRVIAQPTLYMLGMRLPLYSALATSDDYDVYRETSWLRFCDMPLPLGVEWTVYAARTARERVLTKEQAERLARLRADAALCAQSPSAAVTQATYDGVWNGEEYTLTARYVCNEDIAQTVPLLIAGA